MDLPFAGVKMKIAFCNLFPTDPAGCPMSTVAKLERELSLLQAVAAACSEESDEDRLLVRVTGIIEKTLALGNLGVAVYSAQDGLLHDHLSSRRGEQTLVERLEIGQGLVGLAAKTGRPVRAADVRLAPGYCEGDPTTRSELAVPMQVNDQLIGVINCEGPELDGFTEEDERLLVILAALLAPAIARLRTLQTVQRMAGELERRVRERTIQLEAANKEMEAFSYSVSHDLRAPLRSIDGFSQILQEDYQDQLDAEARGYLERIRNGTRRMGQLIDDLLNLSRINRRELVRADKDLSELCLKALEELAQASPERQVQVAVQPDMRVQADHQLLQAALANLLGNAWKFTARSGAARIEVGELPAAAGSQTFFIRDNGAGFDMAYADKLFQPFQRLHTEREFEGSGIGLAIVQRIIHRHGGRIWAEGTPGEGATFFFSLPA